jgi:hypothetical protein
MGVMLMNENELLQNVSIDTKLFCWRLDDPSEIDLIERDVDTAKKLIVGSTFVLGERLARAKVLLGHGNWGKWLKKNGIGEVMAKKYMRVAKVFGSAPDLISDLSPTKVFELCSLDDDAREFVFDHDLKNMTVRQIREVVKQTKVTPDADGSAIFTDEIVDDQNSKRSSMTDLDDGQESKRSSMTDLDDGQEDEDPVKIAEKLGLHTSVWAADVASRFASLTLDMYKSEVTDFECLKEINKILSQRIVSIEGLYKRKDLECDDLQRDYKSVSDNLATVWKQKDKSQEELNWAKNEVSLLQKKCDSLQSLNDKYLNDVYVAEESLEFFKAEREEFNRLMSYITDKGEKKITKGELYSLLIDFRSTGKSGI